MGTLISYTAPHLWKENEPDCDAPSKYDPLFGFKEGRKYREFHATEEEMNSAGLEHEERDYCAHVKLKLMACQFHEFPLLYRCQGIKHEVGECALEDVTHNMKEFERERRLMERESRIRKKNLRQA